MKLTVGILLLGLFIISIMWYVFSRPRRNFRPGPANQNLMAYAAGLLNQLKTNQFRDSSLAALSDYTLEQLETGLPNDRARIVFWVNVYNAGYQIHARRRGNQSSSIFTDKSIAFSGFSLSLDDIEHGILRKYRWKYSLGYLPQFMPARSVHRLAVDTVDFRIHFVLNCGARSCPPIRILQEIQLEDQLSSATRTFLQQETTIDSTTRVVYVSRIMLWFMADFGGMEGIKTIISTNLGENIAGLSVKFNDYDWSAALQNFYEEDASIIP